MQTVYAEARDKAGNKVVASYTVGNIDKLKPTNIAFDPNTKTNNDCT